MKTKVFFHEKFQEHYNMDKGKFDFFSHADSLINSNNVKTILRSTPKITCF